MRHDAGIQLVFAGGTCLSKAHGLIDPMSEDNDMKEDLKPTEKPLKRGRGCRVRLVGLNNLLPKRFARLYFPRLTYEDKANPRIRDVHRYYVIGAGYESAYPQLPSLRPELKLELIQREPLLPVETREFGYLHESLAGLAPS